MIGMLVTPIKVQLGPIANGLIVGENFAAAQARAFPGSAEFLKRYSVKAAAAGIDPMGFAWAPFAYGGGQVLAQARHRNQEPRSRQARRIHAQGQASRPWPATSASPRTASGRSRAWIWTQVQNAQPNNLDQFRDGKAQPIVWPPEAKTGTLIYPYADARKK